MNNEAQFGVRFAVKNAKQVQKTMDAINAKLKQMGVSAEQVGKKVEQTGKEAESTGKKQDKTLDNGVKKADKMSSSLDRLARRWLSIGGAITLVSMIIRKAFNRIDELTGLNRMAQSAGVAQGKIYSLGKELKKLYGGDVSDAASAYTSLGDILGGARSGRGISSEVVTAASRYGIALNGGMLTEDQLMTNIAVAMKAQRNKGNMYGVRDIANAFGISEAMMLHLSKKGKDWDRGLPAANLKEAQENAAKARDLQAKIERIVNQLIDKVLPLLIDGMQAIIDLVDWLNERFSFRPENAGTVNKITPKEFIPDYKQVYEANKSIGMTDDEARAAARSAMIATGQGYKIQGEVEADLLEYARNWADFYNKNMNKINANSAINHVQDTLSSVGGANAYLIPAKDGLRIEIIDKAGVLRNMDVIGKVVGSNTINVATSVK